MQRNEKGRFVSEEASYGYYSRLLKKPFDTLDELKEAEAEYNRAHEAEIKAKEARKAEAEEVKAAIKARLEAEVAAKKAKTEAYKAYLAACESAEKAVAEAKKVENAKLTDFCKKHPEGFHDTVTSGDITYTVNYNSNESAYVDPFIRLLNWF